VQALSKRSSVAVSSASSSSANAAQRQASVRTPLSAIEPSQADAKFNSLLTGMAVHLMDNKKKLGNVSFVIVIAVITFFSGNHCRSG